jgi:hypothetical protein
MNAPMIAIIAAIIAAIAAVHAAFFALRARCAGAEEPSAAEYPGTCSGGAQRVEPCARAALRERASLDPSGARKTSSFARAVKIAISLIKRARGLDARSILIFSCPAHDPSLEIAARPRPSRIHRPARDARPGERLRHGNQGKKADIHTAEMLSVLRELIVRKRVRY